MNTLATIFVPTHLWSNNENYSRNKFLEVLIQNISYKIKIMTTEIKYNCSVQNL